MKTPLQRDISNGATRDYPFLTARVFAMGVLVSMGGLIFGKSCPNTPNLELEPDYAFQGYDTGQISGFLEIQDFLQRFGECDASDSCKFSNVRQGLIVAMVCNLSLRGCQGSLTSPSCRLGRSLELSLLHH